MQPSHPFLKGNVSNQELVVEVHKGFTLNHKLTQLHTVKPVFRDRTRDQENSGSLTEVIVLINVE